MINSFVGDYAFYYIEANVFCIIILLILYIKVTQGIDHQRKRVVFSETLATAIVYYTIDMFWILVDSGNLPQTPVWLYLVNIAYYIGCSIMSYVVSYFMLLYEGNHKVEEHKIHFITSIPCLLNIILVATTPLHRLCFYVDGDGKLATGILYPFIILVAISYPIVVAIRAVYMAALRENYIKRNIYRAIGFFPVFPVGLGLMQVFHQKIPFLCFGLTIALLLTYIEFTDDLISLDPLTKLNNRNELYRYMTSKMHAVKTYGVSDLYLMIMDVDSFKIINDTYGHNEGDRALKVLARTLKKVCAAGQNRFVARFGGDEFIVVVNSFNEQEIKDISNRIHNALQKDVAVEQLPFDMDVSIGYAKYDPNFDSAGIGDILEKADVVLYEEKKRKHQEIDYSKKKLDKVG